MAACQVYFSDISVFTLKHPAAANWKNFSTDESSTFDESTSTTGIDLSDTEIEELVREVTKKKTQKKKRPTTKQPQRKYWLFKWNRIKILRRLFVIHLNNKEKSMQKNGKKIVIFSWNLEYYLVEINNCVQLLNHSI